MCAVSEGKTTSKAIRLACAASTLTVSKKGAAPSIPYADEVCEAMKTLETYSDDTKEKKTSEQLCREIKEYVDGNIRTARLGEPAKKLGYSETYTGMLIKKVMNESFSRILQERRCVFAAKLLVTTDLSVGEIINKIGYENESFFRRNFKEMYGKTQNQYRKTTEKSM